MLVYNIDRYLLKLGYLREAFCNSTIGLFSYILTYLQFPNEFIRLFRHADYATYNTKFCITKRRTIEKALLIL